MVLHYKYLRTYVTFICGPGILVGIATDYGLDGPGSNPGGDENFRPSRPALGPTQPPVQWVPGLSRGRGECRGPRESTAIPLLTPRTFVAYKKGRNLPVTFFFNYPVLNNTRN